MRELAVQEKSKKKKLTEESARISKVYRAVAEYEKNKRDGKSKDPNAIGNAVWGNDHSTLNISVKNGKVAVNNDAIGFYPGTVQEKSSEAAIPAAWSNFKRVVFYGDDEIIVAVVDAETRAEHLFYSKKLAAKRNGEKHYKKIEPDEIIGRQEEAIKQAYVAFMDALHSRLDRDNKAVEAEISAAREAESRRSAAATAASRQRARDRALAEAKRRRLAEDASAKQWSDKLYEAISAYLHFKDAGLEPEPKLLNDLLYDSRKDCFKFNISNATVYSLKGKVQFSMEKNSPSRFAVPKSWENFVSVNFYRNDSFDLVAKDDETGRTHVFYSDERISRLQAAGRTSGMDPVGEAEGAIKQAYVSLIKVIVTAIEMSNMEMEKKKEDEAAQEKLATDASRQRARGKIAESRSAICDIRRRLSEAMGGTPMDEFKAHCRREGLMHSRFRDNGGRLTVIVFDGDCQEEEEARCKAVNAFVGEDGKWRYFLNPPHSGKSGTVVNDSGSMLGFGMPTAADIERSSTDLGTWLNNVWYASVGREVT